MIFRRRLRHLHFGVGEGRVLGLANFATILPRMAQRLVLISVCCVKRLLRLRIGDQFGLRPNSGSFANCLAMHLAEFSGFCKPLVPSAPLHQ